MHTDNTEFASDTRNLLAQALATYTSATTGIYLTARQAGQAAGLAANTHPLRACKALAVGGDYVAVRVGSRWYFAAA